MSQASKRARRAAQREAEHDAAWRRNTVQGVKLTKLATPKKYYGSNDNGKHFVPSFGWRYE